MKRVFLFFVCLAFAKAESLYSQNIDWDNAPMNPVALNYKLNHYNLKADVFAIDYKVFDKKGRLISNNLLAKTFQDYLGDKTIYSNGYKYILDDKGRVVSGEFIRQKIVSKSYYYDQDNNLISEFDGSQGKRDFTTYRYDDKNRVISKINTVDKIEKTNLSYSYENTSEGLKITITDQLIGTVKKVEIWKNGLKVYEKSRYGDKMNPIAYDFDNKGNVTVSKGGNRNNENNIFYYDDNKESYQLTIKRITDNKPMFGNMYDIFRDGKLSKDMVAEDTGNDVLVYDSYSKTYARYKNGFKKMSFDSSRVDVSNIPKNQSLELEVLSDGNPYLLYKDGDRWSLYNCGEMDLKANIIFLEDQALIFSTNRIYQEVVFKVDNINKSTQNSFYPVSLLETSDDIIYAYTTDKKEFQLFKQGNRITDKEVSWGKLKSGEFLYMVENKPVYILPKLKKIETNKIFTGRKYSGEAIAR